MSRGEPVGWITVRGNRVPLFDGESKADAVKRFTEGKKDRAIKLNKKIEKVEKTKEDVYKKQGLIDKDGKKQVASGPRSDWRERAAEREKVANSEAKLRVEITRVSKALEKKKSVGLKDAVDYMNYKGSSLHVNYRDSSGKVSAWMDNKYNTGDGISVRASSLSKLEDRLSASGYTRERGRGEYEYIWRKK